MNVHAWVLETCRFSVYKQLTFFLCVFHWQIIIFSSDFCPHHHSMIRQILTLFGMPLEGTRTRGARLNVVAKNITPSAARCCRLSNSDHSRRLPFHGSLAPSPLCCLQKKHVIPIKKLHHGKFGGSNLNPLPYSCHSFLRVKAFKSIKSGSKFDIFEP